LYGVELLIFTPEEEAMAKEMEPCVLSSIAMKSDALAMPAAFEKHARQGEKMMAVVPQE
jgi:hypothetical protein